MTVIGSKDGKIVLGASDIAEVRNWRFAKNSNNKEWASSSTSGHMKNVGGMKSGTVTFDVVYDPDDPIEERMKPGDSVTLILHWENSRKYTVPCRIESMEDEVQIEEGEPPTVAVEAQTNGAWTYPDGTVSS